MRNNKTNKCSMLKVMAYTVTVIWCVLIIMPLIFLFSSSMKDDLQIYDTPPKFFPDPPISISVVLDYSEAEKKGEEYLKQAIMKDSTLSMYSVIYEINKSGVFNIEFYGTAGSKVIYKATSNKMDLQMNLTYLVYDKARVTRDNLLEKYEKSIKNIGYSYDPNGLKTSLEVESIGKSGFNTQIKEFLENKYKVEGVYKGVIESRSYKYAFKNYIGYWKLPKVLFAKDKMISKYSFLWFGVNTVIITCFAIIAQIIIDSLAAYALSRLFNKKMSKMLLIFILAATMIPFVAYMVPMYVMFQNLKLADSYWGMLIPHATAVGFFIYLYKGFFDKLPKDLFEAARIDGASEMRNYFTVCMPLSKPVTAVIAINTLLGVWNDFFWPFLIVKKETLWPLNVALYNLTMNSNVKQNFIMGMAALTIIPLMIIVVIFGDNLKKGMVFTGIKG